MPEFIAGGEAGLRQFIAEHIEYPELAQENDIQGTVYIRFVVTKTGTIGDVQVVRGVDPLLDEEAVRVVKSLPKFKPGMQGGRPVPVWFSVPIVFQLNN
jgi:protein TonB